MNKYVNVGMKLYHKYLDEIIITDVTPNFANAETKKGILPFKLNDIGKVIYIEKKDSNRRFENIEDYFSYREKCEIIKQREVELKLKEEEEKRKKEEAKRKYEENVKRKRLEKRKKEEETKRKYEEDIKRKRLEKEKHIELVHKMIITRRKCIYNGVRSFEKYYPSNYDPNDFTYLMWSFKEGRVKLPNSILDEIESYIISLQNDYGKLGIVLMPSSKRSQWGAGIYQLADELIQKTGICDCRKLLVRIYDTACSKSGNRSIDKHIRSIEIDMQYLLSDINGYVILDDIMTTGNSLISAEAIICKEFSNPNFKVFKLAIAETVRHY